MGGGTGGVGGVPVLTFRPNKGQTKEMPLLKQECFSRSWVLNLNMLSFWIGNLERWVYLDHTPFAFP